MRRRGFTLLELLVTATIILILTSLAWGALYWSVERGREESTRMTLAKIETLVRPLWESYPSRRVPVTVRDAGPAVLDTQGRLLTDAYRAFAHNARRDLMRIELPDRWADVLDDPLFLPTVDARGNPIVYGRQEKWRQMHARAVARSGQAAVDAYESCECLYLVATSGDRDAARFGDRETGDVDGDGLKEFLDAWGWPIAWHRWPAGWATRPDAEGQQPEPASSNTEFDTLGPYPMIFSAGSDGIFDVNRGVEPDGTGDWKTYHYGIDVYGNLNPWTVDENNPPRKIGEPLDATALDGSPPNGSLDHYDNITNYGLATR